MKPLAKTLTPLTYALAALGLAGAAVTPALATETEKLSVTVSFADLDLGTEAGQKSLNRRLEKAARTVCRTNDIRTGMRLMSQDARTCLAKVRLKMGEQVALLVQDQRRGG